MDPERYQRVKAVFHEAVEHPPEARAEIVRAQCGDDAELRQQVEALLASHDLADEFLSQPAMKVKASDLVQPAPVGAATATTPSGGAQTTSSSDTTATEALGDEREIGPYRLLEVLGEGGMGTVYKAEQLVPVRRMVALKLIKLGMDTREVVARFEAERQALAMMDHPCIARVLDAGATARGRPYFVMEYVPGVPITEHADRHNLNTHQRLRLFLDVCDAIHHAHQRAVIHRDLKPSNILVMFQDGHTVPKIIDFGIAKATNHHLTERTVFTEQGRIIGTPEYMSPEQAEMTEQGVDIRTDVYSLGVILYELLAGVLPFTSQELRAQGYAGLQKTIREVEPPRPSTRITTLGATAPVKIAQARSTDLRTLVRQLRGDLDWVVMKAMAKSRTERYETAFSLSEDIRRYMADEPVRAKRPSVGYRMRKFVRRNRLAVGTVAAVIVALAVGLVVAYRAYRELAGKESELRVALAQANANEQRATENEAKAVASEQEAQRRQQEAEAALQQARESRSLADTTAKEKALQVEENDALVAQAMFGELLATADSLWPTYPDRIPDLRAWLERMTAIAGRVPMFETIRARLRARALPIDAAQAEADRTSHPRHSELQALEAKLALPDLGGEERARLQSALADLRREVSERRTWTFADPELGMKHAVIAKLIDNLARAHARDGLVDGMRWRLREAEAMRERSIESLAGRWTEAAIAVTESRSYAAAVASGLRLVPQLGLAPLGADPKSGLQEFAVLQTGTAPQRDSGGVLAIDGDSAVVLVLLPGGTFHMGASRTGQVNVDPSALDHEAPVHEVKLAPFFIGKHEMTQAQWQRWMGGNPSYYRAGTRVADMQDIGATNPVETVTWEEADEALRRLGLELPTEAQWEFAARAGTSTAWFTGDAPASLQGFANLAATDSPRDWSPDLPFADGYLVHAPATAVAGNAFGLHHVLGNVSEWCRDAYGSYADPVRAADGLRAAASSLLRVHRGGSYRSNSVKARLAARENDPADARSEGRGLRPARRLDLR
ncbi:MAG: SUMF1/EgtB/PvdO family nonheme iron enzyme [Planctomycetota bacterium]